MKCYQCHKEMGRNRYPMIYCRQPFCEKCGRVRQYTWGPTDKRERVVVIQHEGRLKVVAL